MRKVVFSIKSCGKGLAIKVSSAFIASKLVPLLMTISALGAAFFAASIKFCQSVYMLVIESSAFK
jgi:hypothetical protein